MTNDFPQVDPIDPETGRVIRLAGEETLNRDEYRRRISLIREAIDGERSGSTGGGVAPPSEGDVPR